MRRGLAVAVVVVLLAVAHPVEQVLRADAPSAADTHRLGTGRLLGSVLTGAFRPLLQTYLWIRIDTLEGEGRIDESVQANRFMIQLYPNNPRARDFLGWRLAFNMKSEAPGPALGWVWSREGLDILVQTEEGRSFVADWIRKQCGQNSVYLQRYAGPAWELEKQWRARLRPWGQRHYGAELSRFELGLRVLRGRESAFDRARRAQMLEALAYEELLRQGRAPHAAEAVAALREMSEFFADDPAGFLGPYYADHATLLEALAAARIPPALTHGSGYQQGVALWGLGAHRRDDALLAMAEEIFRALEMREEFAAVRQFRAHLEDPARTPRPSLPLDGVP